MKDAAEKAKAEAAGEWLAVVSSWWMQLSEKKTPASAEWKKGSNVRGAAKAEAAANKADEAARRRREKAELLKGKNTNEPQTIGHPSSLISPQPRRKRRVQARPSNRSSAQHQKRKVAERKRMICRYWRTP